MGITSVADPDMIEFTPIGEGFLKKHGRQRCPCCRADGVDRVVEVGPAIRGSARKKAAVCSDHVEEGRAIFRGLWRQNRPDHSEAAFSLGL